MKKASSSLPKPAPQLNWLKTALTWLDEHIILLLTGFLLAFIPLYPKLPLFDAVPGYIVRVRLEDILVAFTAVVWLIQAKRGKVNWRVPGLWLLVTYAAAGLLSLLTAMFIIHTIPLEFVHVAKSVLHYFRYLEYFTLLLFTYSAIKTKADVWKLLSISLVTLVGIILYGYGQKFYYWPVYSTMNREFSKGIVLYLTDHARVQSTFGGHYDLAAYLVVLLPVVLSFAFTVRAWWGRLLLHFVHLYGVWLMVVAASRISFGGYVLASLVVIWLVACKQTKWWQKLWWGSSRSVVLVSMLSFMMLFYGQDIYERFLQVLEGYPKLHDDYHALNDQRKRLVRQSLVMIGLAEGEKPAPPSNGVGVTLEDQKPVTPVIAASDQRPVTEKPSDVYVNVPITVEVATTSATGVTTTTTVEVPRTYSANALKYGLSTAIRLDTLWPRAIAGFWKDPVLGSGYATLTKESVSHFTEADSTDNNFLRTLGETGLVGFLSFYGIVVFALTKAWQLFRKTTGWTMVLGIGFIAGSLGLLLNAVYIDVYASSKVAFTYWSLVGLIIAVYQLTFTTTKPKHS